MILDRKWLVICREDSSISEINCDAVLLFWRAAIIRVIACRYFYSRELIIRAVRLFDFDAITRHDLHPLFFHDDNGAITTSHGIVDSHLERTPPRWLHYCHSFNDISTIEILLLWRIKYYWYETKQYPHWLSSGLMWHFSDGAELWEFLSDERRIVNINLLTSITIWQLLLNHLAK